MKHILRSSWSSKSSTMWEQNVILCEHSIHHFGLGERNHVAADDLTSEKARCEKEAVTWLCFPYFHAMQLYSSTPVHLRGKHFTFYSTTLVWQLQLLVTLQITMLNWSVCLWVDFIETRSFSQDSDATNIWQPCERASWVLLPPLLTCLEDDGEVRGIQLVSICNFTTRFHFCVQDFYLQNYVKDLILPQMTDAFHFCLTLFLFSLTLSPPTFSSQQRVQWVKMWEFNQQLDMGGEKKRKNFL